MPKAIQGVRVTGAKELIRALTDEGYLVADPLEDTMKGLAKIARDEAVSASGSSGVAREIRTEVSPLVAKVVVPLKYAHTLNVGRKPGAKMPSTDQIRAWARSHGFDESLDFVLARAIARRGRKGRFFVRKAKRAVRQAIPGALDVMGREVRRRFHARAA